MLYFLYDCFPDFDLFFDSAVIYIFHTFPYIFHSFSSGLLSTYLTRWSENVACKVDFPSLDFIGVLLWGLEGLISSVFHGAGNTLIIFFRSLVFSLACVHPTHGLTTGFPEPLTVVFTSISSQLLTLKRHDFFTECNFCHDSLPLLSCLTPLPQVQAHQTLVSTACFFFIGIFLWCVCASFY